MLDEGEFAIVDRLYRAALRATKEFRQQHNLPLAELDISERFRPVLDAYEQLTGFHETNANAIMHHRLASYGPPCTACGRPLRTPRAARCMACGAATSAEPGNAHS
jgi:hypothetical protein